MDNQTAQNGGVRDAGNQTATPAVFNAANSAATQTAQPQLSPQPTPPPARPPVPVRRDRSRLVKRIVIAIIVLVLLGVGGVALFIAQQEQQSNNAVEQQMVDPAERFETQQLPLGSLGTLTIEGVKSLSINGQLRVNNSLILSPSGQPTSAVAGQIYYDQAGNQLAYYNGSEFVDLLNSGGAVESVGGVSGSVALGGGLSISEATIVNTGVLSVQGQTGDITLAAGDGIVVDGTTISNTGLLSLGGQDGALNLGSGLAITGDTVQNTGVLGVSAGSNVSIVDNGNGSYTISSTAGGGNVSTVGGTVGRIAKFTGVNQIGDSLLSEGGTTVTVNGNLSVTGTTTLGTPLAVTSGGVGVGTLALNGVVIGQGVNPVTTAVAGAAGQCLISTAGAPTFQACPGSGGVVSLNGLTGTLTIANASGVGTTITIDNASTSAKGIAQFNATNFNVVGGVVDTIQDIDVTATPTFGQLTLTGDLAVNGGDITSSGALNVTSGGTLTLGSTGLQTILQGNTNTQITATGGGFTTTIGFTGVASGNVVYNFDRSATAGSYTVCSTAGNCAGVGGGVTTPGGTTNRLSKFTSAQGIGDSTISDDGATVTTSVDMVIQGGDVTIGVANSQTGSLAFAHSGSGFAGTIVQGALTADRTYTLPDASGTICLTSGNCSGSGSSSTLQAAYDAGNTITTTDGRNIVFTLSDLTTDPNFLVNLTCDTACSTNGRFAVQKDGVDVFTVSPTTGEVAFQNTTNSATAFQVKDAAGINAFLIDTTDGTFLFGEDTVGKHVQIDLSSADGIVDIGATGGNLHFTLSQLSNGAAKINTDSDLIVQRDSNSTSAFQVQNAAGTVSVLQIDTTNILTRISGAGSDANLTSGTGAMQIGADGGANLAFDDNEIVARNNGGTSTLFLQNGGGGLNVGANSSVFQVSSNGDSLTVLNSAGNRVVNVDTAEGELELGTGSTINGTLLFRNATNNFVTVLRATSSTAHRAINLPDEDGTVCLQSSTSCGFAAASGSGNYINNTATVQTNANIAIESASDSSTTMYLRNRATQTADILLIEQSNGDDVFKIDTFGGLAHSGQANFESYTGVGIPGAATSGVGLRVYSPTASDIGVQINANLSQTADIFEANGESGRTLQYTAGGTLEILGGATQTADLFEIRDNGGNILANFGPDGGVTLQNSTDLTDSFRVNNAAGGYVFNVDAANSEVDIGFLEFEIYDGLGGSMDTFFANSSIGIGTARADQIDIGRSGATTTIIGNLAQNTGTFNLVGSNTSSLSTTSGTLTLQSVNGSNNLIINGGSNSMTLNTGASGTITVGSSNTATVNVGALTNNARTVNVGVGTGGSQAQTVNIGSQGGTSTTAIQGGSGATAIAMTTATNGSINATTTGTGRINLNTASSVRVTTTTDSTTALNVVTSLGNNAFTVDTLNSRVGINLGGTTTPTLATAGLEINGALRLSGGASQADDYITPQGATISSAINIVNYNPGSFGQIMAMGVPSTADSTARVLTLLDARTTAHQPTLAILSPNESQIAGLSFEGINTGAYLKSSSGVSWVIRSDTTDLAVFEATTEQNGVNVGGNATAAWHVTSTVVGNDLLKVTDGATNVLLVADEGATTLRNSTNSTNAFQVQDASGAQLVGVDSTNSMVNLLANSTGHLASFTSDADTISAREGHQSVVVNGYVYVLGGCDSTGTATNDVQYAQMNSDGSVGAWAFAADLPSTNCNAAATTWNGYIYVSDDSNAVYYAKVNSDGTINSWSTSSNTLPTSQTHQSAVAYKNRLYVIAARDTGGGTNIRDVYYATINSDGSISSFTTVSNWLPTVSLNASAAVANGYLYVTGGRTGLGNTGQTTTYYGKINNDGTLAAASTATAAIPSARYSHSTVINNGYIYVLGGADTSGTYTNTVQYGKLDGTGNITTTWTTDTTTLPAVRGSGSAVVMNGYVYYIGGWDGANEQNTVYYSSGTRLKVGASLDLVGYSGEGLAEGGSGGQLTAGNTYIAGKLDVTGETLLRGSANIIGNLQVGGGVTFKGSGYWSPSSNSTSTLLVQNVAGANIFAVDTSNTLVQIGSATADTTGVLLVLDGKSTTGDPSGVQGGMYYNEALAAFRCYEDGTWKNCSDPRTLNWGYRLEEDFYNEGDVGWDIGTNNWTDTTNGTGADVSKVAVDTYSRPGQMQLTTGTTATGFADIYLGEKWDANEQFMIGGGELIEFSANLANLSNGTNEYVLRMGLHDEDGPQDATDGVYFEYDRTTSTNWIYATSNNTTRTKTASSKAVATGWVNFRILISGSGGTATGAQFFVRNAGETTWTSLGTINTNLPNNRGTAVTFDITKTAGTTARTVKIDYFNMYNSLGSPGR